MKERWAKAWQQSIGLNLHERLSYIGPQIETYNVSSYGFDHGPIWLLGFYLFI